MSLKKLFRERKSPYSFEQTLETIESNVKNAGWKIPKTHNFQKTILKNGFGDVGKLIQLEICSPYHAYQLVSEDDNKLISIIMPCSISVYEKSDGNTYVATTNLEGLGKEFGGVVEETMLDVLVYEDKFLHFLHN
jgi:uncharacterized protein (DUF302 family)